MSNEINECLTCYAYDPDFGCTMSGIDLTYGCPFQENDEEFEAACQSFADLSGQQFIFANGEDDYPENVVLIIRSRACPPLLNKKGRKEKANGKKKRKSQKQAKVAKKAVAPTLKNVLQIIPL